MELDLKTVAAVWGAVLSTALAGVKVWEIWRDRVFLTTSYGFSSSPDYGDTSVTVENPTGTPVLVTYWELVWADRQFGITRFERGQAYPDEGYCNITIGAHDRHRFPFGGEDWFRPVDKIEGHPVKLYLRLFVAGRKNALWLMAWKPD